ncbi:hypothetical protein XabCFBP2524_08390 [Xanthomonas axonopodis pv. begoniae]|nr:hypothetical protein XabCFBP2524_08390 [Xanthomonas axonopodis pv. begoniae]
MAYDNELAHCMRDEMALPFLEESLHAQGRDRRHGDAPSRPGARLRLCRRVFLPSYPRRASRDGMYNFR